MTLRLCYALAAILLLCCLNGTAQVHFANPPLAGVEGVDYWIVNYPDHDTSTGIRNYECGDKTYDTHQGTDFLLRSFKTMDSGVYVLAVASGRVFVTRDGLFDRNKHTNPGGFGNYVGINHQGLIYTYYAHLMTSSLLVAVGDSVTAGQRLGKVACSGNCTDPHVHLEVWDNVVNVDPFTGPCQTAASLWLSQPFYDTSLLEIDGGFTPYVPNLDTLKERYLVRDTFYVGMDTTVNFWIQIQGVRIGDINRVDWYTPSGAFWYSFSYTNTQNWWYDYFWTYITMPTATGAWTANYFVNSTLASVKHFYVLNPPVTDISPQNPANISLRLSPNPCRSELHIDGTLPANTALLITDLAGRALVEYPPQSRSLSVGSLPAGTYLLKCGNVVKKVTKE